MQDALEKMREVKPHQYTDEMLAGWLSELDGQIYVDVMQSTEDAPALPKLPYRVPEDLETVLLAQPPFDGLYVHWLAAQIDYWNGEYERYNNGMVMYNVAYQAFVDAYNRTHMPRQAVIHV